MAGVNAKKKKTATISSVRSRNDDSESDATSMSASEGFDYLQNQNKEERLEIRRGYRKLMEQLHDQKHDMINPESTSLSDALQTANDLNKNVRMPREGALDSATILMISNYARMKVDNLKTDFLKFEPIEYAEKLISFINQGQPRQTHDVAISERGWVNLGAASQKFFLKSPAFHFMAGSFERGEPVKKVRRATDARKSDKENLSDKATVPKQMKSFDDTEKSEATTAEVEKLYGLLQHLYKETDCNPICYFEFVLHPQSFSQTVENIFYTSFLVRDGLAQIILDDEKLPLIEPIQNPEQEKVRKRMPHKQAVVSISPQEWKELIEVYNIHDPLIPTRESVNPSVVKKMKLK
ncbi:EP300-interacting inhibitor of differentiation 3-like [Saccostrea echinata]|uniref:EP300-interacting inhibitor of differentiation 3-like n=1 Tax=Saccostrea echinata TaxID=191078 RepID=UPI002A81FDEB|nr:EP300-interacting inhibitor of differentiation 3-like [Saccostrea echinata]